jgi:hypothetical protein
MSSGDQAGAMKTGARAVAVAIVLTLAVLASGGASAALASPPTVTLSGTAAHFRNPGFHFANGAKVDATLSNGFADGSLSTTGVIELEGEEHEFSGHVTCMAVQGNRVVVGALGHAYENVRDNSRLELPGSYAQVLVVEFSQFKVPRPLPKEEEEEGTASYTFEPQFGRAREGVPSETPPNCNSSYSGGPQKEPGEGFAAPMHLSPEITSPSDGSIVSSHTVTLSGIGEPNGLLGVYEVAQPSGGHLVTVAADGEWSATFTNVPDGTHVYTAGAIAGSNVPANTVQVNVEAPPPPGEPQPPGSLPEAPPGFPGGLVTAIATASPTIIINNSTTTIVRPVIKLSVQGNGQDAKVAGGHLALSVDSNTSGDATVAGYLSIRKGHRRLRLGSQMLALTASHAHNVALGLSTAVAHQLQVAKRKGEPITALITITLRTGTGQAHTEQIALNVG